MLRRLLLLMVFLTAQICWAEKIEGIYTISKIKTTDDYVEIHLTPQDKNLPKLYMETDRFQDRLQKNVSMKIVGDIFRKNAQASELAQAMFFLPTSSGSTPVWILSRHSHGLNLSTTPYMKMHAPTSDYKVF